MKNINIYSVAKMTVRDGFISYSDNVLQPFYQEISKRSENNTKQSFIYKIKLLYKVLKGDYILVKFENEK